MARKGLTEIVFILDRSGSMQALKNDAIGGFNAFIEKQKKQSGEAVVTVALFDDQYEVLENGTPIDKVKPLSDATYVPRGMTALYDAVGRTINEVEARVKRTAAKDRPEKIIAVVITDGHENASKEFRGGKVKEMIADQREKNKWEVIFIGADENMMGDAQNMGLGMTRGAGGQSVSSTYSMNLSSSMTKSASFNSMGRGFSARSGMATMDMHGSVGSQRVMLDAYDAINTAVSNYRDKGTVGDWTKGEDLTKDKTEA
jgi:uncharacterized protein YegL